MFENRGALIFTVEQRIGQAPPLAHDRAEQQAGQRQRHRLHLIAAQEIVRPAQKLRSRDQQHLDRQHGPTRPGETAARGYPHHGQKEDVGPFERMFGVRVAQEQQGRRDGGSRLSGGLQYDKPRPAAQAGRRRVYRPPQQQQRRHEHDQPDDIAGPSLERRVGKKLPGNQTGHRVCRHDPAGDDTRTPDHHDDE